MQLEIQIGEHSLAILNQREFNLFGWVNQKELKAVQAMLPDLLDARIRTYGSRVDLREEYFNTLQPIFGNDYSLTCKNGIVRVSFKPDGYIRSEKPELTIYDISPPIWN